MSKYVNPLALSTLETGSTTYIVVKGTTTFEVTS